MLGKDLWSKIRLRRYGFILWSLMLLLLLRINIAPHYNILLSSLLLLQNLFCFIIIKLRHQNCPFGCPSLWLFFLSKKDVCTIQRSFVFNKPLPKIFLFSFIFLWLFLCFFSCGSTPSGNHFWNITFKTMAKWHTSFLVIFWLFL